MKIERSETFHHPWGLRNNMLLEGKASQMNHYEFTFTPHSHHLLMPPTSIKWIWIHNNSFRADRLKAAPMFFPRLRWKSNAVSIFIIFEACKKTCCLKERQAKWIIMNSDSRPTQWELLEGKASQMNHYEFRFTPPLPPPQSSPVNAGYADSLCSE